MNTPQSLRRFLISVATPSRLRARSLLNLPALRWPGSLLVAVWLSGAGVVEGQQPVARTQPAGPVRAVSAQLNGMALTKGLDTTAWFDWGPDRAYGNSTLATNIGSGIRVVRVSTLLEGLTEGGVYHCCLVVSNSAGVARGFDAGFTTGMRVQNWGSFSAGPPLVPPGLTNLVAVAAGHGHSLAIKNDGTVVAWMVGPSVFYAFDYGQAEVPAGLSNVVAVAGGFSHSLALKEDETVVAWGKYSGGSPVNVPANLTNVIAIAGGDYHSVALKEDGTVVAWGGNSRGQTNVPYGLKDVVAISCGSTHTLALKADGTIATWGLDSGPPPSAATNVVAIATEGWYNLALRADGTVVDWGGPYTDFPMPADLTNIVGIATGYGYGEALRANGTLVGWGRGADVTNIPPGLTNVLSFASGDYHRTGLAPVDLPPVCFPQSRLARINTTLTFPLLAYDPNGDPFAIRITTVPAKGTLYQYTTNGPGEAIYSAGTVVPYPCRVIFVPAPDEYGSPYDTFSFAASDTELDGVPAAYTIAILPQPIIQTASFTSGPPPAVQLAFAGVTNVGYSVLRSATLGSWTYLGAATEVSPGQFSFTDSTITNSAVRFYRVRSP